MGNNMKILRFLKSKTWYQQLAIVSFLLLSGAALLNVLTPKPSPATPFMQNSDGTTTTYTDLTFSSTSPKLPEELPLGKVVTTTNLDVEIIKPLEELYRLDQTSADSGIWLGPRFSMSQNSKNKQLTLSLNAPLETKATVTKEGAISQAESYLAELYPTLSLKAQTENVMLLDRGPELQESKRTEAPLARIFLSPSLADYPIVFGYNFFPAFEVYVGAEGIEKITITPPIVSVEQTTTVKTITAGAALENLKQTGGGILSARHPDLNIVDKTLLQTGEFSSVTVEYRVGAQSAAIPMYRFKGEFTTSAGEKISGEVLTPAVELGF
ncbi:MAG: hypothetical protein COY80_03565 [Candidatus Pacebacteria bacterium CG_4_10_14_0_8_um_filter_42_14]|nr:MAG: hypothetical protein COY80_03565 [Candidatus Pacebacteria bacterium CG_4_10_14_0_8_um_filter_42_14]